MSVHPLTTLRIKTMPVILAVVFAATACNTLNGDANAGGGSDNGRTPTTDLDSGDIVLTSGLETVDSCDALLDRLIAEGLERVGPYGFGDGHFGIAVDVLEGDAMAIDEAASDDAMVDSAAATEFSADAESAPAARGSDGSGGDFSGTNNQESSVDEADLVKTDGRRLVTVQQNTVYVVDVSRDNPRLESTIKLPEEVWGGELFLNGDSALLMTSGWTEVPFMPVDTGIAADMAWYPGMPTGRLIELDLEEGQIVRTLEFEGSYLSAREVEGTIRIALQASANRFAFLFPSNSNAEDAAEEFNRDLIADSTIDQWIPTYRITEGEGRDPEVVEQGPIVDCDRVHLPGEFAGFGSLVILTADLDDGLRLGESVSVFTDGQTVYASTDRMVVATPRWPTFDPRTGEPEEDADYRTALHSFDITSPDRAEYIASGSVVGHLLSRYSLSEYRGYIRVATTAGTPWNSIDSESFVTVLDERDRELVPVGQVGGLGLGEQIFAVRFMGDLAYVVTFEQIDPLYVVDLRDPENPTVEGELKIPGFSTYLHPLDDGLLMAVGVDGNEQGITGGSVVSLFDVSDSSDPRLIDKMPLARVEINEAEGVFGHTHSPVDSDPRAFTYWDDTAVVPVGWWMSRESGNEFLEIGGTEAVLIQVDDDRLVEIDRVAHPLRRECEGPGGYRATYVDPDDLDAVLAGNEPDSVVGGLDPDRTDGDRNDDGNDDDETESTDAEASFVDPPEEEAVEPPPAVEEAPPAVEVMPDREQYCWYYSPEIIRSVIVGDNLYTVAHNGIGVHDWDRGSRIEWIPFEAL